jgi:SulP family sulfate permease
VPWALILVFLGIAISAVLDFELRDIHIVGEIPGGLPTLGLVGISLTDIWNLLPGAVGIMLVAYAESVAAAKSYAAEHQYEVDDNQEMIAIGAANLGAGFSQGFVVDGSLSRTAAADEAGQKSQLASLVNSGLVLVTAVLLTPLFRTLPEAVLGAIVIHAVWRLITFREIQGYYKIRRPDFWAAVFALLGVLTFGILLGLILAVTLSLLSLLWRASRPSWNLLGRVSDEAADVYASLDAFPDAETIPGLVIFRFNQQIFFANATGFRNDVRQALRDVNQPVHVVLVDAEVISDIDITGLTMLEELCKELSGMGIELWFARVRANVMDYMRKYNLEEMIGPEGFYLSVRAGVDSYLSQQA